MKTIVQTLMGKTEEWERTNPVLLKGALGIEVCAGGERRIKIGDGMKNWKSLVPLGIEDIFSLPEELGKITGDVSARDRALQDLQKTLEVETENLAKVDRALQEAFDTETEMRAREDQYLQQQINILVPAGLEYLPKRLTNLDDALEAEVLTREQEDVKTIEQVKKIKEENKAMEQNLLLYINENSEQLKNTNKRIVGEYRKFAIALTEEELSAHRLLKLEGQIIEIALYQELCDKKWVGAADNATALFWYKCNEDGTRNIEGLYMVPEDGRGMFYRNAGKNSVLKAANNTPYDGNALGSVNVDKLKSHRHYLPALENFGGNGSTYKELAGGGFIAGNYIKPAIVSDETGDNETAPVWLAVNIVITY